VNKVSLWKNCCNHSHRYHQCVANWWPCTWRNLYKDTLRSLMAPS